MCQIIKINLLEHKQKNKSRDFQGVKMVTVPSFGIQPKSNVVNKKEPMLSPFFEKIIDKKVNKIALNIFERIIDTLCAYCYSAYQKRLNYRLKEVEKDDKEIDPAETTPQSPAKAIAKKVIFFADGAPLYDRTHGHTVSIQQEPLIIQGIDTGVLEDQILIDGKTISFTNNQVNQVLLFGAKYGTKKLVVADVKEFPEIVYIYERETSDQLKAWCVDTTQNSIKQPKFNAENDLVEKEILLAKEIAQIQSFP